MSDDDNADGIDSDTEDLGAPVALLKDHAVPVPPHFRGRVVRSIERRVLAADVAQFGFFAPFSALMELLRAVFEGLGLFETESKMSSPASPETTE
jgi:hypothetical protein